jgi:DNA-binding beta-propeller fold protein YncE
MDGTGENARFSKPYGIGFDAVNNNIYVADWGNQRIRKISLQ